MDNFEELELKRPLRSLDFGKDFIWGVSSSALQTEGAHNKDGKGPNIWDEFADLGKIKNKETHYEAGNFYENFEEDISLIKALKIPNFRFSISWARLIPDGTGNVNEAGINYYHKVIDTCIAYGIEPWVTLYHWDLPLLLERKGGWTNREILIWFEEYVSVCVRAFGSKVKHWMVLNEPLVFTGAGYFAGLHAPGKRGLKNFLAAAHHACLCMGIGLRTIKAVDPSASVGTTFNCFQVSAYNQSKANINAAIRIDALVNRMFIEAVLGLGYPKSEIKALKKIENYMLPGDAEMLKADFDFIGLQVYTREVVRHSWFTPYLRARIVPASKRKVYHTKMDWEVYPNSIYETIKKYSAYEGVKKIFITENGASFHDEIIDGEINDTQRIHYLEKHIAELHRAYKQTAKIAGYFVWSLTDNFEWAEGFEQRFGLIHIDYKTKKRSIKNSAKWYSSFLKE